MNKILFVAIFLCFALSLSASENGFFDDDDQFPYKGFVQFVAEHGLEMQRDEDSVEALQEFVQNLRKSDDKRLQKYAKNINETLNDSNFDQEESYQRSLRIIFALYTEDSPGTKWQLKDFLSLLGNGKLRIKRYKHDTISEKEAKDEASNLYLNGQLIQNTAGMNVDALSKLDISANHSWWYNQINKASIDNIWRYNEEIAHDILTRKVLDDRNSDQFSSYSIKQNRRFFLFDKIKTGGTSTKIAVKDLSGIKWGMKWGDEVQSETISNRLYTAAGAKFADLVYPISASGENLAILVLDKTSDEITCEKIATYALFVDCLKRSKYKADVTPFVHSYGTLSKEDISTQSLELAHVAKDPMELVGRNYIIFKEGLVELRFLDEVAETGAATLNSAVSDNDRVMRSLSIFNAWIASADTKDENNRSYLLKNSIDRLGSFVEYQHDFGTSLGTSSLQLIPSNGINALEFGKNFVKARRNKVVIKNFVYYKPTSWKKVTFADARWMTQNILNISSSELRQIINETSLPSFMADILQYRLEKRRQDLAQAFDLNYESQMPDLNKSLRADLSSPRARANAAKNFGVSKEMIETVMLERKLIETNDGLTQYKENVIDDFEIVSSRKSVIIAALERESFPSGLAKKLDRFQ